MLQQWQGSAVSSATWSWKASVASAISERGVSRLNQATVQKATVVQRSESPLNAGEVLAMSPSPPQSHIMSSMYNEDDFNAFLLCTITYLNTERPSSLVLSSANVPAAPSRAGKDREPMGKGRVTNPTGTNSSTRISGLAFPIGVLGAMRNVITAARCLLQGEWRGAGSACASNLVFRALP